MLAGGDKTTLRQRAERAVACSADVSRRFVVVSLAEAEALRALCHSGGGADLRLRALYAAAHSSSVEASILGTTTCYYHGRRPTGPAHGARSLVCDVDLDPSHGAVEQLRRCLGNEEGRRRHALRLVGRCAGARQAARRPTPLAPFGKATSTEAGRGGDARATLVRCAELDRRSMSPADCFEAYADGDGY